MNKVIKGIVGVMLAGSFVWNLLHLIDRYAVLKQSFEYGYYELRRQYMDLAGIAFLLVAILLIALSLWKDKLLIRAAGYACIAAYGTELVIWEFLDAYKGYYYFPADTIHLLAYLAIPIVCLILILSVKKCCLAVVLGVLVCVFFMYWKWTEEVYEVPVVLAAMLLNMQSIKGIRRLFRWK